MPILPKTPARTSQHSLLLPLQLTSGGKLTRADCQFLGLLTFSGSPISISFQPALTSYRGKLLSGRVKGTPVYAASFLRRRSVVLESSLLADRGLLRLILVHEVFHFVWLRLGNPRRHSFTNLLDRELLSRARGELGESAAVRKDGLEPSSSRLPRDYVCESFCDTAAWMYAGLGDHRSFTLAPRWQKRRRLWFEANMLGEIHC